MMCGESWEWLGKSRERCGKEFVLQQRTPSFPKETTRKGILVMTGLTITEHSASFSFRVMSAGMNRETLNATVTRTDSQLHSQQIPAGNVPNKLLQKDGSLYF